MIEFKMVSTSQAKKHGDHPLERSSYEFMAALVVASVIQLIPNWVAYLLCCVVLVGVAVYFCWCSRGTIDYGRARKFFLSICSIVFIVSVTYGQVVNRYREANIIPPTVDYMTGWGRSPGPPLILSGSPPKVVGGVPSALVTVDGRLLDRYKKQFSLMAVLLHVINNEPYMDKVGICTSNLVRIRPEDLSIPIAYNSTYLSEIQMGANVDNFFLLAVPKNVKPGDFKTLGEAEDKGVQIIGKGGSTNPPAQSLPNRVGQ